MVTLGADVEPTVVRIDGNGNLTAGQKTGFLSVVRDQVRFRKALKQAFGLQGSNDGAHIVFGVEQEQIQEVTEREFSFI